MYELIQYSVLTLICSYLVISYSAPSVSFHVKFWSVLTWVLNFGLAMLVPEDVYITLRYPGQETPEGQKISFEYLSLYWSVYILTWTIIPLLQGWEDAGDLDSRDRMKRSLKDNGIFYLYMLIGGVIVLLSMIFFNVSGEMGLKTYLKCLATCWGIFLLMIMMGYAIVEIPRSLWLSADTKKYIQYCYEKVKQIQDEKDNAIFQFKQICAFILYTQSKSKGNQQILKYCTQSMKLVTEQLQHEIPTRYDQFLTPFKYLEEYPICLESSIQHHRLMKRILARHRRLVKTLAEFIDEAILYEDVQVAKQNDTNLNSVVIQNSSFNNLWYLKLQSFFYKFGTIVVSIYGILILISESQVFLGGVPILRMILHIKNLQVLRAIVYLVIGMMAYMVYYSMFRLKLSNLYGLYKNGSDGPSLMFATINFSRVGGALVLNFFEMINLNSIYVKAMGTVQMGLLGEWVIKGMPGVLWLIVLCHYFDVWGKLIDKLKLSDDLRFYTHKVTVDKITTPILIRKRRLQLNDLRARQGLNENLL